jgi:hypothetical protein
LVYKGFKGKRLRNTFDLVIEAVRAGELDTQIGSAAGVLKRGFKK